MTKLTEGWKSKERKIRLKKGIMRMLSFSCYLLLFVFVKKKKKKTFSVQFTHIWKSELLHIWEPWCGLI